MIRYPLTAQPRSAFYLSGANFPGVVVTYDIGKDALKLWIPVRDPGAVIWYGALPSVQECAARFDVDAVENITGLKTYLEDALNPDRNDPPQLYILHRDQRPPPLKWECSCERTVLQPDDSHLQPAMDLARAVKSDFEVAQIRRAVDVSSRAHSAVQEKITSLASEADVENLFLFKCREQGAKVQAYSPIAGAGPNAAVLHYDANDRPFGDSQLLVLDAGAEWECYASDVTRTLPLNGAFTHEAKKVYGVVAEMQDTCISMIRPGASWRTITLRAMDIALKGLLSIGLLQLGRIGDKPPRLSVGAFFMHGLGHLVGLDTHDVILQVTPSQFGSSSSGGVATKPSITSYFVGKFGSLEAFVTQGGGDNDRFHPSLKENMVITVEPGLYFNRAFVEDWMAKKPELAQYVNKKVLEAYYPVGGCRIEDCILVTKDGHENLTKAPKGEEMIRVINGGKRGA